jgi:MFS family permease
VTEMPKTEKRQGRLGYLLASTGVSVTGDGVLLAATPLLAASLSRDPLQIGIVSAAGYAAWLSVGLPAGALVDRWPRRRVMVTVDLLRTLVLLALVGIIVSGNSSIWALAIMVFVLGIGSCFFDPAGQAMIPALVGRDKDDLARANGRFWALDTFGRALAGPPLGAAAFAVARFLPFAMDALSFLLSALFMSRLPEASRSTTTSQSILVSVRDGVHFLSCSPELRALVLGEAGYNLGWNIASATLVLFAQDVLHVGNVGYGLLLAAGAAGGVLSARLAPRLAQAVAGRLVFAIGLLVQAASWLLVLLGGSPWLAGVGLVALGFASNALSVVIGSTMQRLTPDDKLGRVVAAGRVLGIGSAAIGAFVGGLIAEVWGLHVPFLVAAVLVLVISAVFFLCHRQR